MVLVLFCRALNDNMLYFNGRRIYFNRIGHVLLALCVIVIESNQSDGLGFPTQWEIAGVCFLNE